MIKTATPDELERIAAKLYAPVRAEFALEIEKLRAILAVLEQTQVQAANRLNEFEQVTTQNLQRLSHDVKKVTGAQKTADETLVALTTRLLAAESTQGLHSARIDRAHKQLSGKMVEILATFARFENRYGK